MKSLQKELRGWVFFVFLFFKSDFWTKQGSVNISSTKGREASHKHKVQGRRIHPNELKDQDQAYIQSSVLPLKQAAKFYFTLRYLQNKWISASRMPCIFTST